MLPHPILARESADTRRRRFSKGNSLPVSRTNLNLRLIRVAVAKWSGDAGVEVHPVTEVP